VRVSEGNLDVNPGKERLVLFLGSGFSAAMGLPTTNLLSERIGLHTEIEDFITECLGGFWEKIFGWSSGKREPTFEDHFTQIDLAANTGHQLGPMYSPKKLRAIR
jgi:hypothetical protein